MRQRADALHQVGWVAVFAQLPPFLKHSLEIRIYRKHPSDRRQLLGLELSIDEPALQDRVEPFVHRLQERPNWNVFNRHARPYAAVVPTSTNPLTPIQVGRCGPL